MSFLRTKSEKYSVGFIGIFRSGPIFPSPSWLSVWQVKQYFINTFNPRLVSNFFELVSLGYRFG